MGKAMVTLPRSSWDAVVRFFRAEEKLNRDSFVIPGQERTWRKSFKHEQPEDFKLYDAARKAIESVER